MGRRFGADPPPLKGRAVLACKAWVPCFGDGEMPVSPEPWTSTLRPRITFDPNALPRRRLEGNPFAACSPPTVCLSAKLPDGLGNQRIVPNVTCTCSTFASSESDCAYLPTQGGAPNPCKCAAGFAGNDCKTECCNGKGRTDLFTCSAEGDGMSGCICERGFGGSGDQACKLDERPGPPSCSVNVTSEGDVAHLAVKCLRISPQSVC